MQMRFVVSYALLWPGTCLVVAQPWHVVHHLMQPYENAVWVQHGIDPVEDVEHKLALLPDGTPVGVDRAGVIPVLQEAHQICPFPHAMDSYVHLVILTAGRRSWKLCIRGVGRRVHELSGNERRQEVDTSVGRHQGSDGRHDHTASYDCGLRVEGGQASDLCVVHSPIQIPHEVPDELLGVGLKGLIWGISVVLRGGHPLYYGLQFWSLLCR